MSKVGRSKKSRKMPVVREGIKQRAQRRARNQLGKGITAEDRAACQVCKAGLICLSQAFGQHTTGSRRFSPTFLRNFTWLSCHKCEGKILRFSFSPNETTTQVDQELKLPDNCPHQAWHTADTCKECRTKKRKERTRKHARKQNRRR